MVLFLQNPQCKYKYIYTAAFLTFFLNQARRSTLRHLATPRRRIPTRNTLGMSRDTCIPKGRPSSDSERELVLFCFFQVDPLLTSFYSQAGPVD